MARIGVLGGMGPAATIDFMAKLAQLTPARCDQEHLPVVVANLPHVPDRSTAITEQGADPLWYLLQSVDLLNAAGCGLIAIACNTAHHWHAHLAARSRAPVLHIVDSCMDAIPRGRSMAVLATRGCLASGFYQRAITQRGETPYEPADPGFQGRVDEAIAAVKRGDVALGAQHLTHLLRELADHGVGAAILGCTELPVAAAHPQAHLPPCLQVVDSTLELARAAVRHGLANRWNVFDPSSMAGQPATA